MYEKAPTAEELAAWGLTLEDVATVVEIWDENAPVFRLFQSLRTQWNVGMSGPVSLNYLVAYHKMDRMGLTDEAYAAMEADLQVMETTAILVMRSK